MLALGGCSGGTASGPTPPETAPAARANEEPSGAGTKPATKPGRARSNGKLHTVEVKLERVAAVASPTALAVRPPDGDLYVSTQAGQIRAIRDGQLAPPLIDIAGRISTGGERGLLGFTFSQDGDEVFVSYTNVEGDSRVDVYPLRGPRAVVGERRELLAVDQPYPNHNGGNLVFGPDGMLYLGLGDGGGAGDPKRTGQDPSTLLGKMLRLDPRNGSAPPDNPFVGRARFRPEIFAIGLRNPWRFSFDRATDDLWVGDVGQDEVEEVNVTPFRRAAGRNYAWSILQGSQPYHGEQEPARVVRPVVEYATGEEGCAVTGGYVYRGKAIPALRGAYLYSDFCSGWIRAVRVRGNQVVDASDLGLNAKNVSSFGEDAHGELYVLSLAGAVFKLVPA